MTPEPWLAASLARMASLDLSPRHILGEIRLREEMQRTATEPGLAERILARSPLAPGASPAPNPRRDGGRAMERALKDEGRANPAGAPLPEPDVAARLDAQSVAELEAVEVDAENAECEHRSLIALANTLAELAGCVIDIATGDLDTAREFHLEASMASVDAAPPGTREGEALATLLDFAGNEITRRAA
jgi:hypothetical protein